MPLSLIAEEGLVRISWPAACTSYSLQTATILSVPIQWTTAPETPVTAGDFYTVTVQVTNVTRFFRLHRLE